MYSPLFDVSCASPHGCVAVGQSTGDFTAYSTLAERWNGTKWSIEPTPTPGGTYGSLNGVDCPGAKACMAVGQYQTAGNNVVLSERWNGTKWSVLHPPNPPGASASAFFGVSCTSARACTAVGNSTNAGVDKTLVERWNGKAWSIKHTPNPTGSTLSHLDAVSCTSRRACEAGGVWRNGSAVWATLAERWNGKKWSIQHTLDPAGAIFSEFKGVSCAAQNACIAAGDSETKNNHSSTLAERWNGKKWTLQHTLDPTTDPNHFLYGVSCASASTCIAVGYTSGPIVWQATLVEHWNGSKWSVESSPHAGTDSQLQGVSCSSTSTCTAVGWHETDSGPQKTLVEHR